MFEMAVCAITIALKMIFIRYIRRTKIVAELRKMGSYKFLLLGPTETMFRGECGNSRGSQQPDLELLALRLERWEGQTIVPGCW